MKVTVCPNCRITPEITNTMLKCPKCGRTATGETLNETVTKWNAGIVTTEFYSCAYTSKVTKAVIEDEEAPKEEIKEEIEDEIKEEPKRPAPKKAVKPVEKTPVKRTNTKRGMK